MKTSGWLVTAAATALAVLVPAGAAPAGGASAVFYQVEYADGSVRDLNAAPTTNEGIGAVTRISRFDSGRTGREVLATGDKPVESADTAKVVREALTWDGEAWLSHDELAAKRRRESGAEMAKLIREQIAEYRKELAAARRDRRNWTAAVAEAEQVLAGAKGTDGEKPALALLERAKAARDNAERAAAELEHKIAALQAVQDKFERPTGRLKAVGEGDAPPAAAGIDQAITAEKVVDHRVQAWKLPPGKGRRTIRVSMAHAKAGEAGAFRYVAYADADGDGKPDTVIGHSPLAVAEKDGGWTSWQFTTDRPVVFVGNTWWQGGTPIYCQPAADVDLHWKGLSSEVYVSGVFGGIPSATCPWPYYGNIRVWADDGNPDEMSGARGSKIIIRERD